MRSCFRSKVIQVFFLPTQLGHTRKCSCSIGWASEVLECARAFKRPRIQFKRPRIQDFHRLHLRVARSLRSLANYSDNTDGPSVELCSESCSSSTTISVKEYLGGSTESALDSGTESVPVVALRVYQVVALRLYQVLALRVYWESLLPSVSRHWVQYWTVWVVSRIKADKYCMYPCHTINEAINIRGIIEGEKRAKPHILGDIYS